MLSPEASDYLASFRTAYPDVQLNDGSWTNILKTSDGRRFLTRLNPRLFAMVYLAHHLRGDETGDVVSFSEAHLDWYEQMLDWVKPTKDPKAWRRAYVAPRNSAKSTTWFLIAPMWAAAHGHAKFVAAFADSATQAEGHLTTFKSELDTNELLRQDYPELCAAQVRPGRGTPVADNRSLMHQKSGFIFSAKGVDSATLGLKVGERRPDLIILDDIEPTEANYSAEQSRKRLSTIQNAILPLNDWARVVMVGTVTMDGSLIHQLVKSRTQPSEPVEKWITDERFTCHYYPALTTEDDGSRRSLWPEKWPLSYLEGMEHTRSFALNYQNLPMSIDGIYWQPEDIVVEPLPLDAKTRTILSIDPAVTTKTGSDFTGMAVLSHDPTKSARYPRGRLWVRYCVRVKLGGKQLMLKAAQILEQYPEVRVLYCEINQGGDLWADIFGGLGVKYVTKQQSVRKEVRAGWLLDGYQKGWVRHDIEIPGLTSELLSFPGLNDDQVDAVGSGYSWLTGVGQPVQSSFSGRTV